MKRNQATLFETARPKLIHGGAQAIGKRKERRPLAFTKPVHLVLRAEKAKGDLSFLSRTHRERVRETVERQARKHYVRVQSFANGGNHLHVMLRAKNRAGFQAFLRSVTAMIARQVTAARRGKPFGKFWDALAFTRVITSSREERILRDYLIANRMESTQGTIIRDLFLTSQSAKPWRNSRRARPG